MTISIFLCYASEDHDAAESIALALRGGGFKVFFDKSDLAPGGEFNSRIHLAIKEQSGGLVFLVSPDSVADGAYTLTELKFAKEKWEFPENYVLPVMVRPTPFESIPQYLTAVTVLKPAGNIAAEVLATVREMISRRKPRRIRILPWAIGVGLVSGLLAGAWYLTRVAPLLGRWDDLILADIEEHARYLDVSFAMSGAGLGIKIQPTDQRSGDRRVQAVDCTHSSYDGKSWEFVCIFGDAKVGSFKFERLNDNLFLGGLISATGEPNVKQSLQRVITK